MNREETTQILAMLKAAFPNSFKNMTQTEAAGTVTVWQTQFEDIPAEIVYIALQKVISVSEYPPTIAAIRGQFRSIYIDAVDTLRNNKLTESEKIRLENIKNALSSYYVYKTPPEIPLTTILKSFPNSQLMINEEKTKQITGG